MQEPLSRARIAIEPDEQAVVAHAAEVLARVGGGEIAAGNAVGARRLDEEQVTLEFLGNRLGISKERVRQIENRALEKLRKALSDLGAGMPLAIGR